MSELKTKECNRCHRFLLLKEFGRCRRTPGGRRPRCLECSQKAAKARDEKRAALGLLPVWKEWRLENPESYRASRAASREKRKARERDQRRRDRLDAIYAYGGKCVCCGENDPHFLVFDHRNNDGGEHRRKHPGAWVIVRWLKKNGYPQDGRIQILCHNCNMSKALYGCCPHQFGMSS